MRTSNNIVCQETEVTLHRVVQAADHLAENMVTDDVLRLFMDASWWKNVSSKIIQAKRMYRKSEATPQGIIGEAIGQTLLVETVRKYNLPDDLQILGGKSGDMINMRTGAIRFDGPYNAKFFGNMNDARYRQDNPIYEIDMVMAQKDTMFMIDFTMNGAVIDKKVETEPASMVVIKDLCRALNKQIIKLHLLLCAHENRGDVYPLMDQNMPFNDSYVGRIGASKIVEPVTDAGLEAITQDHLFSVFRSSLEERVQ